MGGLIFGVRSDSGFNECVQIVAIEAMIFQIRNESRFKQFLHAWCLVLYW
jgi:hypothetical protein